MSDLAYFRTLAIMCAALGLLALVVLPGCTYDVRTGDVTVELRANLPEQCGRKWEPRRVR